MHMFTESFCSVGTALPLHLPADHETDFTTCNTCLAMLPVGSVMILSPEILPSLLTIKPTITADRVMPEPSSGMVFSSNLLRLDLPRAGIASTSAFVNMRRSVNESTIVVHGPSVSINSLYRLC